LNTKKDYFCSVPFINLEIHNSPRHLCCGSWLKKTLPANSSPYDAWNSEEAHDIRESILDGSYRYCDETQCPYLGEVVTNSSNRINDTVFDKPFYKKAELPEYVEKLIEKHKNGTLKPSTIQFSFDRTCNLKCPSCRLDIITASSKEIDQVQTTIDLIKNQYSPDVRSLYITGSGDPFISVGFRKFLRDINLQEWPNLYKIHLHTNATKWNKKMWDSMKNIHSIAKTCEISIDAGTQSTYETETRLGGDWNELIENLKFISTIKSLKSIKTSFVVQDTNYKEMKIFYDLMLEIFGKRVSVFFGRLTNWGTFTEEEFQSKAVHLPTHPLHQDFLEELGKVLPNKNTWTNLQEFVQKTKSII